MPVPDQPPAPAELRLGDHDMVEAMEVVEHEAGPHEADVMAEVDQEGERTSGFEGVGTRREARERALALLYEAEQKDLQPLAAVLASLPVPAEPFAVEIVEGVSEHQAELDDILGRYAVGWTVVRMAAIDRNLLRIGAWELIHTDVPVGACISEAVELAKRYSTDDSHVFVNGLLGRLAGDVRHS